MTPAEPADLFSLCQSRFDVERESEIPGPWPESSWSREPAVCEDVTAYAVLDAEEPKDLGSSEAWFAIEFP